MNKFNLSLKNSNINMMKPLNYFETLQMIRNSKCVITDWWITKRIIFSENSLHYYKI